MNPNLTELPSERSAQRPAAKFAYASGTKPLDGYTIKRGIGRGGFGEVYFAVSDAGKEVALKLIRRHLDVELRGVKHCLNLKHPNLLAIHDIRSSADDEHWIVMEYVSGESLGDVIDRNPNGMPEPEALRWFHSMAAGTAYLHERGIVHRDLKPGNIFSDEGIVKIGDYGLSKFVAVSQRSGHTESVGTVHYMAPEIGQGRYGKEIDIYALGVIFYEMLTGTVPFEGESAGEVLMKHLSAKADLDRVPHRYRAVIGRCLEKDAGRRYGSVKQLIAELPPLAQPAGYVAPGDVAPIVDAQAVDDHAVESVPVALVPEEPIWAFVRTTAHRLSEAWRQADVHPLARAGIWVAGIFVLLAGAGVIFPAAFVLMLVYGAYRMIRAFVLHTSGPRVAVGTVMSRPAQQHQRREARPAPSPGHHPRGQPSRQQSERQRKRQAADLTAKPLRQKVTELTGSMLLSAGVALVITIVMTVFWYDAHIQPEQFTWLALGGTVGAWLILIPAKFWEGRQGDATMRRFVMLIAGMAVGAAVFGLGEFLSVDLDYKVGAGVDSSISRHVPTDVKDKLYAADGSPRLFTYLGYFGLLFALLRWWLGADPSRLARLSLWSTALCVFAAWLLNVFWPFPQPWGFMLAGVIAVSVQLSSPWLPTQRESYA